MGDQLRKLSATTAVLLDGFAEPERLTPVLVPLARRHVSYGVRPDHYDAAVAALLETLRGTGADAAAVEAWRTVLDAAAETMLTAAYPLLPTVRRMAGRAAR